MMATLDVGRVCLVMIVKNESHVIERSLTSVLPFVDEWCISDTGSTDDTVALIEQTCVGKPGEVVHEPWKDFGHNRTLALAEARARHPSCKWLLMIDADDIFRYTPTSGTEPRPSLMPSSDNVGQSAGLVTVHIGEIVTVRPQVFSTAHPWTYKGKLHEFAELPGTSVAAPTTYARVNPCFWIDARTEGARSKNPHKYADDALVLEQCIADNPTDYRSLFYAAQSWRDANQHFRAYCLYKRLANTKDAWVQERYVSCLHIVNLAVTDLDEAAKYAWLALELVQWRCEATVALLRRARSVSTWRHQHYALAKYSVETVMSTPQSMRDTGLFIQPSAFAYELLDEMAVLAFHLGSYNECVTYSMRALVSVPAEQHARIKGNIEASRARMLSVPRAGVAPERSVFADV